MAGSQELASCCLFVPMEVGGMDGASLRLVTQDSGLRCITGWSPFSGARKMGQGVDVAVLGDPGLPREDTAWEKSSSRLREQEVLPSPRHSQVGQDRARQEPPTPSAQDSTIAGAPLGALP